MRFTVRQFSAVLSISFAIAIVVGIAIANSQPAAASGMIAKSPVVHSPATPSRDFVPAAARTEGGCPLSCNGGTRVGIRHCDGQDCEKFQDLCLPPNAAIAHIGEQGTPNAGHEQDQCIVLD